MASRWPKILAGGLILRLASLLGIKVCMAKSKTTAEEMIGMKLLLHAEDAQKRDITHMKRERLRQQLMECDMYPSSMKLENPRNPKMYVGKWVYCKPGGGCVYMYWSFEDHVNHYGHLAGITKVWSLRDCKRSDNFVVDQRGD